MVLEPDVRRREPKRQGNICFLNSPVFLGWKRGQIKLRKTTSAFGGARRNLHSSADQANGLFHQNKPSRDAISDAVPRQRHCSTDGWMTCKWQLSVRCKNAQRCRVDCSRRGQQKDRFGEIELLCDALHLRAG